MAYGILNFLRNYFKNFTAAVIFLFIIFSFLNSCSSSYQELNNPRLEKNQKAKVYPDSIRNKIVLGLHVPSITPDGTFLRVLVVFAQFPDDNWNPNFKEWKKGGAPFYKNIIVDSTLNERPNKENISEYFREMSLGKFFVIGKTLNAITPHSREWYLTHNKRRDFINKEVLKKIDSTFDFKEFDNWTNISKNQNKFQPDGKVDMIWMIYRNISMDLKDPGKAAAQLGFGIQSGKDKYDKWSGEASLGYGRDMYVDDSARVINMGYYGGSGTTVMEGYNGYRKVKNLCIHEFGHHLIGGVNMHARSGYWSMMSGGGSRSPCANSYERNRLGWTKSIEINKDTIADISLDDYITTGEDIKISIPGSDKDEYYYLENHQCKTFFDVPVKNGNSRGLYLLHQTGPLNSNIKLISAAGSWDWAVVKYTKSPWGPEMLPVFKKTMPDPVHGYFEADVIPFKESLSKNSSSLIFVYVDPYTGKEIIHPFCDGWGFDAFNKNYNSVFSEWSNPRALNKFNQPVNVAFQIMSEDNGKINLRIFIGKENVKQIPPSKILNLTVEKDSSDHPLLRWQKNIEPDISDYIIYRSGDQKTYSEFSVLPVKVKYYNDSNPGEKNNEMNWVDSSLNFSTAELIYSYKIAAVDSLGRKSNLSDKSVEILH